MKRKSREIGLATVLALLLIIAFSGCVGLRTATVVSSQPTDEKPPAAPEPSVAPEPPVMVLKPVVVTQPALHDTDDPAIWLHPTDRSQSLIIGTDKNEDGALYAYDLDGNIIDEKTVRGLKRPNNVDIEYGLMLGGEEVDIAVTTERLTKSIRVFRLPDMVAIDNGGIEVFVGDNLRAPMGVALYKRPSDGAIYAIVGRKEGPTVSYLWQYLLEDDGNGNVAGTVVRKFGEYSGVKEIEAIAVDDPLGYVYYSDENVGTRKYHADPDAPDADVQLALFGTDGFTDDNEGISIYMINDGTGYILISDQQANKFRIFPREGADGDPHNHPQIKVVSVSTTESDGCEVTSAVLNDNFKNGLFVAMSDNKTFHFYSWEDIAGEDLLIAPDGELPVTE